MNSSTFITPANDIAPFRAPNPTSPTRRYFKRKPQAPRIVAIVNRGRLSVFSTDADAEVVTINCQERGKTKDEIDSKIGVATEGLSCITL